MINIADKRISKLYNGEQLVIKAYCWPDLVYQLAKKMVTISGTATTDSIVLFNHGGSFYENLPMLIEVNNGEFYDDFDRLSLEYKNELNYMFYGCSSLTSLDLSNFDTSNVTTMHCMFYNCTSLTSLDVSNFDTSNVINMSSMFYSCKSLESLDSSSFDTSNVYDMSYMFSNCKSLISLDLSNFNTSKVTNMAYMFWACSLLTSLDLSNSNTSNVTNMSEMFYNCENLTYLDTSNFDTSKVTNMKNMFWRCFALTHIKCKQSFKDWCIKNYQTLSFDNCDETNPNAKPITWEIVD